MILRYDALRRHDIFAMPHRRLPPFSELRRPPLPVAMPLFQIFFSPPPAAYADADADA